MFIFSLHALDFDERAYGAAGIDAAIIGKSNNFPIYLFIYLFIH